jgi:hypothetical protein
MVELTPASLQQLPLRGLVEFAALCAKRVRPVFDHWKGSPKYRPAIDSAIQYAERFADNSEGTRRKNGSPVGIVAVDVAIKKANAAKALQAEHAATTAATSALATKVAKDVASSNTPNDVRAVVDIIYHAYEEMLLAAETESDRRRYAKVALEDIERLAKRRP